MLSLLPVSRSTVGKPPNGVSIYASFPSLPDKSLDSASVVLYSCFLLRRKLQIRTNIMISSIMTTVTAKEKATSPYLPNGDWIDKGSCVNAVLIDVVVEGSVEDVDTGTDVGEDDDIAIEAVADVEEDGDVEVDILSNFMLEWFVEDVNAGSNVEEDGDVEVETPSRTLCWKV